MELSPKAKALLEHDAKDEQICRTAVNTDKQLPELPQTPTYASQLPTWLPQTPTSASRRATWIPLTHSSVPETQELQFQGRMDLIQDSNTSKEQEENEFQAELKAALDYHEALLEEQSLNLEALELVLERQKHIRATLEDRQKETLVENQQRQRNYPRRLRSTSNSSSPEDRKRTLSERYTRDGELRRSRLEQENPSLSQNEVQVGEQRLRIEQQGIIDRYRTDKAQDKETASVEGQHKPSLPFSLSPTATPLGETFSSIEAQPNQFSDPPHKLSAPFSLSPTTRQLGEPFFSIEARQTQTLPVLQPSKPGQFSDPLHERSSPFTLSPTTRQLGEPFFNIEARQKQTLPVSQRSKPGQLSDPFLETQPKSNLSVSQNSATVQGGDHLVTIEARHNQTLPSSKYSATAQLSSPVSTVAAHSSLPSSQNSTITQVCSPAFAVAAQPSLPLSQDSGTARIGSPPFTVEAEHNPTLPQSQNSAAAQVGDSPCSVEVQPSLPLSQNPEATQIGNSLSQNSVKAQLGSSFLDAEARHKPSLPLSQNSTIPQVGSYLEAQHHRDLLPSQNSYIPRVNCPPSTAEAQYNPILSFSQSSAVSNPPFTVKAQHSPVLPLSHNSTTTQFNDACSEIQSKRSASGFQKSTKVEPSDYSSSSTGPDRSVPFSQIPIPAELSDPFFESLPEPNVSLSQFSTTAQLSDPFVDDHQRTASPALPSLLSDYRLAARFIAESNTMPTLRSFMSLRNLRQNYSTSPASNSTGVLPPVPPFRQDQPLETAPVYHDSASQATPGVLEFQYEEAIGVAGGIPNLGSALHSNGVPVDLITGPTGAEDFDFRYAVKVFTETKGNVPWHEVLPFIVFELFSID